ncbi:MAG: FIST C-terminal domain-containing protein [Planctomycetes bacterium]|nr:FIST C-terminal domain-containing protein [Planctomycetota bacterium]
MSTRVSVGHASEGCGATQGRAAAEEALAALEGAKPLFGMAFATSKIDLADLANAIKDVVGEAPILGCSTAGEFVGNRISAGGTAVCLVSSDEIGISIGMTDGLKANTARAARQMARQLKESRQPAPAGATERTIFLLSDGMAGSGEVMVDTLALESGPEVAIAGGAAGDDAAFVESYVFLDREVKQDAIVAIELTSLKKIGIGVDHGWCAASEPGTVTKAEGATVIEIDGKPAIEFYRRYAELIGFELSAENQNEFVFTNELGIVMMNDELKVRAPLGVNEDGSISCATEIPTGQHVRIVRGDHEAIVAAARKAAEAAVRKLGGQECAGAIVFDCVARKLVLGDDFEQEVAAFREVIGAPLAGFNTYGEIARVRGQLSGFHNTTAVVAVFPR